MTHSRERGMATAEYTTGTLGAVLIAAVLFKLGLDDGWFSDQLHDIIRRAFDPSTILEHLKSVPKQLFGNG